MTLPESPRAMALDGTLLAWGTWIVTTGAPVLIVLITLAIAIIRLMIVWRQWRRGD